MTAGHGIEHLNRLTALLDQAREDARTDAQGLEVLLAEAARTLDAAVPALAHADARSRAELTAATRRARASQAALEHTLREELARVARQLDMAVAGAGAHARYTPPTAGAHRLDRVG